MSAPSPVRRALGSGDFRRVWLGTYASDVGTWMQNVVLAAFIYDVTGSSFLVGAASFAQLGPLLFASTIGGVLADSCDRRNVVLLGQGGQMSFSLVLAWASSQPDPQTALLLLAALGVGVANALSYPAFAALLPGLVPPSDLAGAIALQSIQMNASRVLGPLLALLLYPLAGAGGIFLINAATYVLVLLALRSLPRRGATAVLGDSAWGRFRQGIHAVNADPILRHVLASVTLFSFFCLVFIGLLPVVASENFGITPNSTAYSILYATFGIGAAAGAWAAGTVLARLDRGHVIGSALLLFAVCLALLSASSSGWSAYALLALLGALYFAAITTLLTVLQERVAAQTRGRVLALWIMGYAGTAPLGALAFGLLAEQVPLRGILVLGALVGATLAFTTYRASRLWPGELARGG